MAIKRDAADNFFSLCVRAKANFACEYCGKGFPGPDQGLHCAHIVGRRNSSTRWALDNAVSLCYYHHRYFTENPLDFISWLGTYLGEGHMLRLMEKKNEVYRVRARDRKDIAKHYREQWKAYQEGLDPEFVSWN
jgi:hypothetical protein